MLLYGFIYEKSNFFFSDLDKIYWASNKKFATGVKARQVPELHKYS